MPAAAAALAALSVHGCWPLPSLVGRGFHRDAAALLCSRLDLVPAVVLVVHWFFVASDCISGLAFAVLAAFPPFVPCAAVPFRPVASARVPCSFPACSVAVAYGRRRSCWQCGWCCHGCPRSVIGLLECRFLGLVPWFRLSFLSQYPAGAALPRPFPPWLVCRLSVSLRFRLVRSGIGFRFPRAPLPLVSLVARVWLRMVSFSQPAPGS